MTFPSEAVVLPSAATDARAAFHAGEVDAVALAAALRFGTPEDQMLWTTMVIDLLDQANEALAEMRDILAR